MLNVNEKEAIRRAVLVEGKSQRAVARETGYSRNTIRKMLTDGDVPKYNQAVVGKISINNRRKAKVSLFIMTCFATHNTFVRKRLLSHIPESVLRSWCSKIYP